MEQTYLLEYIKGIFLIDKSEIENVILRQTSKGGRVTEEVTLNIFETLFQIELEKLFQRIEHAAYHSDEQLLVECHSRLLEMTRQRGKL